jgi:chromosome partitioning protein
MWCWIRPAGLHGWRFNDVIKMADRGHRSAATQCVRHLRYPRLSGRNWRSNKPRGTRLQVALVGMRVDARTIASEQAAGVSWTRWTVPMLSSYLRDTQNYVHLAAHGLSLFDVAQGRVEKDLEQWQPICHWFDA